jgi:hypothetical protein
MNMLPSVHDHSLLEYRVDLINSRIVLITLPEAARTQADVRPVQTVFEGREAHHFDAVSTGAILFDIDEASLSEFLASHRDEFDKGHKSVGAPSWWRGTVAEALAYLTARGVRAFEISSSYGFSGWVLATEIKQFQA